MFYANINFDIIQCLFTYIQDPELHDHVVVSCLRHKDSCSHKHSHNSSSSAREQKDFKNLVKNVTFQQRCVIIEQEQDSMTFFIKKFVWIWYEWNYFIIATVFFYLPSHT